MYNRCCITEVILFHFVQANVICIVYSVEDYTSVEKVLYLFYVNSKWYWYDMYWGRKLL